MIRIDDSDLRRAMNHLARAMSAEGVNKKIKRQVGANLRKLMKPMVAERQRRVLALPSKSNTGMRAAIARQTRAAVRWKGRNTGISIIQRARGMPRDFQYAGRMFNREEGWNPTNLGGETEHQQMSPASWFDGAADDDAPRVRREIIGALDEVAGSLADEIRRIR